ncbi:MAG: C1 family peptidase [Bacteroidales bacterium]|nr:C1 family peptidase [Bacteroidales bacterium]
MKQTLILLIAGIFSLTNVYSQKHPDFTIIKQIKTSPVDNQQGTGTCWSYATTSFIETEALRMGKKEYNLSEMYFVYYAYLNKAEDYTKFHGKANFSEGGQAHDVLNVIKNYGLVPESAYLGREYDLPYHYHVDMVKNLESIVINAAKNEKVLGAAWYMAFKGVLDSYMGAVPVNFKVGDKEYNPKSFNESEIGFKIEDYIEFTSYSHHPYYEEFDLEIPDNWSHDRYYNVTIDELMQIMDYAIEKGYSVDWDGDVSEDGFDNETGKADLSEKDIKKVQDEGFQRYRQITFENYKTTDDHLMHITGTAKDKDGRLYYITKNSWGNYNDYGGYLFMSKDYVKVKTIAIMIHKDAVPADIAKKCGIK